ncbi:MULTISPECIES: hypothetical protein [Haloferax]|uniref:Uncharacterized protein n=1 Tax=Haloferax marinum TaxID=2666143 RepID=A0A6A8G940_9EURY|nr:MULTISPECIES: hypothetical protein [Haloferax]KAB1198181.1 hypothetical protein Hfx1150_11915 [Haloferax sp. CBA1150]MRW97265.1 hypothetical protein [Haloferax marinum]
MSTDTIQRVGSIVERTEQRHELVVVTKWRTSADTSLEDLTSFDQNRRRFWRCRACGREQPTTNKFDAACPTSTMSDDSPPVQTSD